MTASSRSQTAPRRGGTVASAQRNRRTLINQPERMQQLRALVEDGASLREIKRTMGVGNQIVKRYFPEAGWPVGAPKGTAGLRKLERAVFGGSPELARSPIWRTRE